jgi:hypothetical protein
MLYSLFFADDGVLIARDRATLQLMMDAVVAELGEICLLLNAKKTKILIVPPLTATEAQYEAIKLEVSKDGGFTARGQSVTIVDEFLYLGVMLWWRWNWKRACEHAVGRAKRVLYLLRKSGFQHQGAALAHQLKYASSVVGSHIDYISALAGVEGYRAEIAAFAKLARFDTPFIAGDSFTLADCSAIVHLPLVSSASKILGQQVIVDLGAQADDFRQHALDVEDFAQLIVQRGRRSQVIAMANARRWRFDVVPTQIDDAFDLTHEVALHVTAVLGDDHEFVRPTVADAVAQHRGEVDARDGLAPRVHDAPHVMM